MSARKIGCPVCGYRFDPADSGACGSCPLNAGCEMVCCPNCGHTTVDVNQSGLVQLANRIVALFRREQPASQGHEPAEEFIRLDNIPSPVPGLLSPASNPPSSISGPPSPVRRLSEIPVGERVRVMSLGEGLTPPRCARLQAYGVVPGYWVKVIQHDPVTVIQVDHLELAMEGEVAEGIWVME
jgi:Fe2+ transport system protein FeoA